MAHLLSQAGGTAPTGKLDNNLIFTSETKLLGFFVLMETNFSFERKRHNLGLDLYVLSVDC